MYDSNQQFFVYVMYKTNPGVENVAGVSALLVFTTI
jgi:hypothetical protein